MEINIGTHKIGPAQPAFVIAEIGLNHNGCMDEARRLIDIAHEAKVSAVKFQKRDLSKIYTKDVLENLDNYEQGFQYLIPILKEFELTPDQLFELKEYCDSLGILFLCTPFDPVSADILEEMNTSVYKISSADLTNFELLDHLVQFKKPLLLSTGMSLEDEICTTVNHLRNEEIDFALLHCVSSYPVDPRDANIGRIRYLYEKYGVPVGYSGHDIGTALSVMATTLGACIIEKHITRDRTMKGPDHKVSLLPEELKRLVADIRDAEQASVKVHDHILQGELLSKMLFRKSIVAAKPIAAGSTIAREDLTVKSPGTGVSGQHMTELIGSVAKRDFAVDDIFHESDLESEEQSKELIKPDWGQWGFVVRYHDFETILQHSPTSLEFHFTYQDTLLDVPHEKFTRYSDQLKDTVLRIHCCEYINDNQQLFDLCSKYPDVLDHSVTTLQRVIDKTNEMHQYFADDQPLIVFNIGAMSLKNYVRDTDIDVEGFYDRIRSLELGNVKLIAQNMPPNPWYFAGQWKGHYFLKAQELIDFCEATGHLVCLDTSHAAMACRYLDVPLGEYVESLIPYVAHIHIADARGIEGEGTQIGTGDVDFGEFFEIYSDYKGTWIPEIWQGHIDNMAGAKEALKKLNAIYNERMNETKIVVAEQDEPQNDRQPQAPLSNSDTL